MAKLVTPNALLSFPHLLEAHAMDEGDKKKFSGMLVWLPGTDLSKLEEAIIEAAVGKWGQSAIAKLKSGALRNPLSPGTKKGFPEGSIYTNARSDRRPGLVYPWADPLDEKKRPAKVAEKDIIEVFYPGATVRAQLSAFAYDQKGNKGVSFGLENIQLVDGTTPRFDGRSAAEDTFDVEDGAMQPADLSDMEQQD